MRTQSARAHRQAERLQGFSAFLILHEHHRRQVARLPSAAHRYTLGTGKFAVGINGKRPAQLAHHMIVFQGDTLVLAGRDAAHQIAFCDGEK